METPPYGHFWTSQNYQNIPFFISKWITIALNIKLKWYIFVTRYFVRNDLDQNFNIHSDGFSSSSRVWHRIYPNAFDSSFPPVPQTVRTRGVSSPLICCTFRSVYTRFLSALRMPPPGPLCSQGVVILKDVLEGNNWSISGGTPSPVICRPRSGLWRYGSANYSFSWKLDGIPFFKSI